MRFHSRQDAGQKLGEALAGKGVRAEIVLGLVRGGVLVAAEIALRLQCPLDALVVRKIGHPRSREFAVGAIAEGGVIVLDEQALAQSDVPRQEIEVILAEERQRLASYQARFALATRPDRAGKVVIIVDDGLATGATLAAGVKAVRCQGARRVIAAVPVASSEGAERLSLVCDEFHALVIDPGFGAVGQYYDSFPQTTDEQVLAALA